MVVIGWETVRGDEGSGQIQVSAGEWDRREVVVSFPMPKIQSEARYLLDEKGAAIPLQIDERQQGSFVLQTLKAGESGTFKFGTASTDLSGHGLIEFVRAGKKLQAAQDGARILDYQAEPGSLPRPDVDALFTRGGCLHPILSPSGKSVSDDFPRDHIHHHGIWFPWTKTEFEGRKPDFWNMGTGTGKVEFESVSSMWSGPVHGGFVAQHRFIDLTAPKPKVALKETWSVAVYNVGRGSSQYRMFDLVSVQKCASSSPLILPQYRYGGLGFRGNQSWDGAENTFFLTSED